MNFFPLLGLVFIVFVFVDYLGVGMIHKITAERHWREKGKFGLYHIMPLTNIPIAIYCWLKFGNPVATWKLLEAEAQN